MITNIDLKPQLRMQEAAESPVLRVSVDLMLSITDRDSEVDLALSKLFLTKAKKRLRSRLGSPDPYAPDYVCAASMDCLLVREVFANDPDALRDQFSEHFMRFDGVSQAAGHLAGLPSTMEDETLSCAMEAADDAFITSIGVEWMAWHEALPSERAVGALMRSLEPLTMPNSGLLLVAGLPLDLGSSHKRLEAYAQMPGWRMAHDDEDGRFRVEPSLDEEEGNLILACGVASGATFVQPFEFEIEVPDAT